MNTRKSKGNTSDDTFGWKNRETHEFVSVCMNTEPLYRLWMSEEVHFNTLIDLYNKLAPEPMRVSQLRKVHRIEVEQARRDDWEEVVG
jgi:hypothetical protein